MAAEYLSEIPDSISGHRVRVADLVSEFRERHSIRGIIGISGGADQLEDQAVNDILHDLVAVLKDKPVAVLTGGTKDGIPELGLKFAREAGLPTVGVYPADGRKYALRDQLDLAIESLPPSIGPAGFGTETPSFVGLVDGLGVIGGEFGTLVEVATALKVNKKRIRKSEAPIYLCPLTGTGGVADSVYSLPGINSVRESLPELPITNGTDAGRFFVEKLALRTRQPMLSGLRIV